MNTGATAVSDTVDARGSVRVTMLMSAAAYTTCVWIYWVTQTAHVVQIWSVACSVHTVLHLARGTIHLTVTDAGKRHCRFSQTWSFSRQHVLI
jgi:hypothetical protein